MDPGSLLLAAFKKAPGATLNARLPENLGTMLYLSSPCTSWRPGLHPPLALEPTEGFEDGSPPGLLDPLEFAESWEDRAQRRQDLSDNTCLHVLLLRKSASMNGWMRTAAMPFPVIAPFVRSS